MKGYKAFCRNKDNNAEMFKLFKSKEEAELEAKHFREFWANEIVGVEQIEIQECKYGHLFVAGETCIKCEDLQFDAYVDGRRSLED